MSQLSVCGPLIGGSIYFNSVRIVTTEWGRDTRMQLKARWCMTNYMSLLEDGDVIRLA